MTYEEFVQKEKAIEANHRNFFTIGKNLSDYILIVYNLNTGYKRYEWINEKGLPEDIKSDIKELISELEQSKQQA